MIKKLFLIGSCFLGLSQLNAQFTIVDYKPCESLTGISTFVDQVSPSNPMNWEVLNGYSGNGYGIVGSCYGGYIEYLQSFTGNSYLEFYCKAFQMGYPNLIPTVSIDGVPLTTTLLNTNTTGSYIKLKTSYISPGNHAVRIEYGHTGMYYQYFIDEINTFSDANSSVNEIQNQNTLIYPNHTNDLLNIVKQDSKSTSYTICNTYGNIVEMGMIEGNKNTLNVQTLNQGIYFIQLGNEEGTKRFLKL
jgi:hypothetical protein